MKTLTLVLPAISFLFSMNVFAGCEWGSYKNDTIDPDEFAEGSCQSFNMKSGSAPGRIRLSRSSHTPYEHGLRYDSMETGTDGQMIESLGFGSSYKIRGTYDRGACTLTMVVQEKENGLFGATLHYIRVLRTEKGGMSVETTTTNRKGKAIGPTKTEFFKQKGSCRE